MDTTKPNKRDDVTRAPESGTRDEGPDRSGKSNPQRSAPARGEGKRHGKDDPRHADEEK